MRKPGPADALCLTHLNRLLWLLQQEGWSFLQYISANVIKDSVTRAELYRKQIAKFTQAQPDRYHALCFDALFVDDAQNLYGQPRPVWRELGINVAVGDRSRVMQHCFRNSRQTVELAFNVLIGTQAPPDLRVHARQYADVAYLREHNLITEEAACVRVHFARRDDAPPVVQTSAVRHEELHWVVDQLVHLVQEEAVRPEDILLLTPKPSAPDLDLDYFDKQLHARLPNVPLYYASSQGNKDQHLFTPNQMTFSTVFGARGTTPRWSLWSAPTASPTPKKGGPNSTSPPPAPISASTLVGCGATGRSCAR